MIALRSPSLRALGTLLVILAAGCGGGPALKAAEQGDLEAARRALKASAERGEVDESEARGIAREVLKREIKEARGQDGVKKLQDLPSCAKAIDDALSERAENHDDVGAMAAMLRFNARLMSIDDLADAAREALASKDAATAWRAVEARGLVTPEQAARRRTLFTDGDQEVRLAAVRASFDANDPADLEALLEAARLDPYPPVREIAFDAIGNLGGERAVLALKDLFVQAEEDERLSIIGAWTSQRSIEAGGHAELVRVSDLETGTPQLAAAAVLMRLSGPDADNAAGVILRAIGTGTTRERVFAISAATLASASVREAIVKAESDPDEDVALAALGRGLEMAPAEGEGAKPKERAAIKEKLMTLAKGKTWKAYLARMSLARAGAREVLPLLVADAQSQNEQARKTAGLSLIALGEHGRAAMLMVDADPRVRRSVACAMLRKD